MELCSLHPVSDSLAAAYVQQLPIGTALTGSNGTSPPALDHRQIQHIGFGLAGFLALEHPTFAGGGLALTSWEARVDRGIAMLIRPPSRLFTDAGLPVPIARSMPIRLDLSEGMMGGAYIPARLLPQAHELMARNVKRSIRRMVDADMDAELLQALMMEAVAYAASNGLGLYEAIGFVDFSEPATWPSGTRIRNRPTDKAIIDQVATAARPDHKPGAFSRMWNKLNRG